MAMKTSSEETVVIEIDEIPIVVTSTSVSPGVRLTVEPAGGSSYISCRGVMKLVQAYTLGETSEMMQGLARTSDFDWTTVSSRTANLPRKQTNSTQWTKDR
jgi:hypothetical protein